MTGVGVLGTGVTLKSAHALGQPSGGGRPAILPSRCSGPCRHPGPAGLRACGARVPPQGGRLLCGWAVRLTSGLPGVTGCSPEAPRGGKPQLVSEG